MKKINLFKFSNKTFCKKRMGITPEMLRELLKRRETELELQDDNHMLIEAFHIQSAVYHNVLFNSVSKILPITHRTCFKTQ
jgi:hypothetical protein